MKKEFISTIIFLLFSIVIYHHNTVYEIVHFIWSHSQSISIIIVIIICIFIFYGCHRSEIKLIIQGKYDRKTKRISIPIQTKIISRDGTKDHKAFSIQISYLKSVTIQNTVDAAINIIHEKSNGIKYTVWRTDKRLTRSLTEYKIIDIGYDGLKITLIDPDIYNGKTISIPIYTEVISVDGSSFLDEYKISNVPYLESTTIENVVEMAMNKVHAQSNGIIYNLYDIDNEPVTRSVTSWDIFNKDHIAYKGLTICLIDSDIYNDQMIAIKLEVNINGSYTNRVLKTQYIDSNTMENVLEEAINKINTESYPTKYFMKGSCVLKEAENKIMAQSGRVSVDKYQYELCAALDRRITHYGLRRIISNGLEIEMQDFVNIPVEIQKNENVHNIVVKISYSSYTSNKTKIENIIDIALKNINEQFRPTAYNIDSILFPKEMKLTEPITNYAKEIKLIDAYTAITNYEYNLKRDGIKITIKNQYRHKIKNIDITCKYLKNGEDLLKCPIYKAMKIDKQYTEDHLDHLFNFEHFRNGRDEQETCKYGQKCESFIRLQNKGLILSDRSHMKLFRHPPRRNRQIKMAENVAFIVNETEEKNQNSYQPLEEVAKLKQPKVECITDFSRTWYDAGSQVDAEPSIVGKAAAISVNLAFAAAGAAVDGVIGAAVYVATLPFTYTRGVGHELMREIGDSNRYGYSEKDGFLKALMEEVIKNGYKYDLCLKCKGDELNKKSTWYSSAKCPHNVYEGKGDTLLSVVNTKMDNIRHKAMGTPLQRDNMMAFLLYTGCDCNYALCRTQRNNDYKTWKWFDRCLYEGIEKLSNKETGKYHLYSGLKHVKMDKVSISNAYFVTYVSSSSDKGVALSFIDNANDNDDNDNDKGNYKGMLIEIDPSFRADADILCCDVSWISHFEYEAEVLIARSIGTRNGCSLKVVEDTINGTQFVSLKKSSFQN